MMRGSSIFTLLMAAVLLVGSTIGSAFADNMPLPALTGRVIDKADILSDATEETLTTRLAAHETATTNQIVIVTLPDLMGRPIEDWGLMLGRSWGIGQKGKDNGIIFLIAPNDRKLRIEVGYGLEGSLPDATASEIIQSDIIPHFKQGDMETGVTAGLDAILAALGGTYRPAALPQSDRVGVDFLLVADTADTIVPVAFLAVFVGVGILMRLRRRWDPKLNRYVWYFVASAVSRSGSRSFGSSRSGFSGGGGSFGGGGASGRW